MVRKAYGLASGSEAIQLGEKERNHQKVNHQSPHIAVLFSLPGCSTRGNLQMGGRKGNGFLFHFSPRAEKRFSTATIAPT